MENRDNKDCSEFEKEYIRSLQEEIKNKVSLLQILNSQIHFYITFALSILGGFILGGRILFKDFNALSNKESNIFEMLLIYLVALGTIYILFTKYNPFQIKENPININFYSIKDCSSLKEELLAVVNLLNKQYSVKLEIVNKLRNFLKFLFLSITIVFIGFIIITVDFTKSLELTQYKFFKFFVTIVFVILIIVILYDFFKFLKKKLTIF
jgi:hypothetical protein